MSDLHKKLAQKGDHHHSKGIIHSMVDGAMIGGVTALLAHLVANGMGHMVDKWKSGHAVDPYDPQALKDILGDETINKMAETHGLEPEAVIQHLADHLPAATLAHSQA